MALPESEAPAGLHWSEFAAALCVGLAFAAFSVVLFPVAPEPHPAPVVGELTFSGAGKRLDFLFVWLAVAGTITAFAGVVQVRSRALADAETIALFREYLAYCCLPAIVWCGGQVLGKPFASPPYFSDLSLIWLSVLLIVLLLLACIAWRSCGHRREMDFSGSVGNTVTSAMFAGFSWIALSVAASRLFLLQDVLTLRVVTLGAALALSVAFGTGLLMLSGHIRVLDRVKAFRRLNLIAQSGLPLAVFALILPPSATGLPWPRIAPLNAEFLGVLMLLAMAGYACLVAAWRREEDGQGGLSIPAASVGAIAVLILFSSGQPTPYGMDNPLDYYHHGEWLIPWQQWATFGNVPYIDYSPSHGLVDYLSGMVNDLLLDGTLAGFPEARQLVRGISCIAAAFALSRIGGPLPALLSLLLFPVTGRYTIFVAIFCGLILLTGGQLQRASVRWLFAYFLTGTALVLLAPGPGAMLVVALAPVALVHLVWGFRTEPRRLVVTAACVVAICGVSLLIGPGEMVIAQIQFMLENRPLYGAVHGLDWTRSLTHDWPVNGAFWEVLRTLWLPAMLVLLLFAMPRIWLRRRVIREVLTDDPRAVFAVTSALFLFLVIPHTIGRIDAGGPSRGGALTVFSLAMICLPLAVHLSRRSRVTAMLGITLVLGLLAPAFGHQPGFRSVFAAPSAITAAVDGELSVDGADIGIPALGRTLVHPVLVERVSVLKAALDGWLQPEETYLDLTNANANYFYTGRSVPVESGAFLTMPAEAMQTRSVTRLERDPPPVLLLGTLPSGTGPFTVPLRVPVLADWVFAALKAGRYQIVQRGPFVFAVTPDRLNGPAPLKTEQLALLRDVFAPPQLARLPSVWGHSAQISGNAAFFQHIVEPDVESAGAGIDEKAPGVFEMSPGRGALNITETEGRTSGLLMFELSCSAVNEAWAPVGLGRVVADHGGHLDFELLPGEHVVPLDADPMTLLNGSAGGFRLELALDQRCGAALIGGVRLASRAVVGAGPQ